MGTAMSGLRCEPFSQGDASHTTPHGMLSCLLATYLQPDAFKTEVSISQLGVKLSSLCASAHG